MPEHQFQRQLDISWSSTSKKRTAQADILGYGKRQKSDASSRLRINPVPACFRTLQCACAMNQVVNEVEMPSLSHFQGRLDAKGIQGTLDL